MPSSQSSDRSKQPRKLRRRKSLACQEEILVLTPEQQLAFWKALHKKVVVTKAQRRLGAMMRGEC